MRTSFIAVHPALGTTLVAVLSFLAAASASSINVPRQSNTCSDVRIFLARGNNEPYPGRQARLVENICDGVASCDYEDLIYSALYTDLYCQSVYDGTIAGHVQMTAYNARCPNSTLILSGYSQGASIVTDILGGGGGVLYNGCVQPSTPALSRKSAPGNKLAAAIVFGNVRHTGGQAYNFGNGSEFSGMFPRDDTMLSALNDYSGVLRDWCLSTDPICAFNQTVWYISAHLGYFNTSSGEAASWIRSVASVTADATVATAIPTSVSGIVQDYSTVGTATPSGTVILNTAWVPTTTVASKTGSSALPSTTVAPTSTNVGTTSGAAATTTTSRNAASRNAGLSAGLLGLIIPCSMAVLFAMV